MRTHAPEVSGRGGSLAERLYRALSSTLDLREVLRTLAELALQETDAQRASLFVLRGERLEPAVALGGAPDEDAWAAFRELGPIAPTEEQAAVLARGRTVVLPDASASRLVPASWVKRFGLQGLVVVPLQAAGRPCGLMALDFPDADASVAQDTAFLEMLAGYAGMAVRNARLYSDARRRAASGEVLARAATALAAPMTPRAVAARLVAAFTDLLAPGWCGVGLIEADCVRPLVTTGAPSLPERIPLDAAPGGLRGLAADAWRSGPPASLVVEGDAWLGKLTGHARHLLVPLPAEGRPVGVALLGLAGRAGVDGATLDAVSTLAALGGTALERHSLLARQERQARQVDVLYRLSSALTERMDARLVVRQLNDLLSEEGVAVTGLVFRDRRLARHLGGDRPEPDEREAWKDGQGCFQAPDGSWRVPLRVGKRVAGYMRVRGPGSAFSPAFLQLVGSGVGELLMRAALRASLEESTREKALAAERDRIAAELQETVGAALDSVGQLGRQLAGSLADAGRPRQEADVVVGLAESARWRLDLAMRGLAFVPTARRGLAAALRGFAHQFQQDSSVATVVNVSGRPARLPGPVERVLYRLAVEALVSSWWHGRSSVVRLTLRFGDGQVAMSVVDDGVGLAARAAHPVAGLGLPGMRRLVTDIGGEVTFANRAPHGVVTDVIVRFRGE